MNKTLEKLKAISGPSFDIEPERRVAEIFDFEDAEEIHLCSDMIKAGLIWVDDGLVGFCENVGGILIASWPEFRQYTIEENAIEADMSRVSIADSFAMAGETLADNEG